MTNPKTNETKPRPRTIENPPPLKCDETLSHISSVGVLDRRVVWNLIKHLEAAGFKPSGVDNGDEMITTLTPEAMMEEVFSVDDSYAHFRKSDEGRGYWVRLILGNSGWDVTSDWGCPMQDPDRWNAAMEAFDGEMYV